MVVSFSKALQELVLNHIQRLNRFYGQSVKLSAANLCLAIQIKAFRKTKQ